MATLILWIALLGCAAWAVWSLRGQAATLRRLGLGGPEEDLEQARKIIRAMATTLAGLAIAALAAALTAERWSEDWRREIAGVWALNALIVVAGAGFVWSGAYTIRQQWSVRGSLGGMLVGMAGGTIILGLLGLAIRWRWY